MNISRTAIESALWTIQKDLMQTMTIGQAERCVSPLAWYISTGRASTEFLHRMLDGDHRRIASALSKMGTDDEAIKRVKKAVGFCEI